jgi:hypothetical protein
MYRLLIHNKMNTKSASLMLLYECGVGLCVRLFHSVTGCCAYQLNVLIKCSTATAWIVKIHKVLRCSGDDDDCVIKVLDF